MRPWIVPLLLFASAVPLAAQNKADVFIYIPPVTGVGSTREDNAFIENMLAEEIRARDYYRIDYQQKAAFSLIGTVGPYTLTAEEAEQEPLPETSYLQELWLADDTGFDEDMWYEEYDPAGDAGSNYGYYVFYVTLKDETAQEVLAEQYISYSSLEELANVFSLFMLNIFSRELSPPREQADAWRNKWLYFGLDLAWTPRIYYGEGQSSNFMNFGGGFSAEFHFLNFMALSAGVELAPDWITTSAGNNNSYRNIMLEIPVALRLVFKPSDYFVLEPYGGVNFNIPLYDETLPALLSWMAGFQYGVKAGPGIIFVDPRFSRDIGNSSFKAEPGITLPDFNRTIFRIGIGYKLGFIARPSKKK